MKKLNLTQRKVVADIFGNLATAWFSIGVISQVVIELKSHITAIISFLFALSLAFIAIIIVRK